MNERDRVPQKVLALDTSTHRMHLALGAAGESPLAVHAAEGGAQASAQLIPAVLALLRSVGWRLDELDAIAFGAGPGAFTGLRTACAVVQGLAVAARPGGIPVLPVPTLQAVAYDGLMQWLAQYPTRADALTGPVVACLDARMDEMYVADFVATRPRAGATWHLAPNGPARLVKPDGLTTTGGWPLTPGQPPVWMAGNAAMAYSERWPPAWQAVPHIAAEPSGPALLALSAAAWRQGAAVPAAEAQPLYVRDKVAQTTDERLARRA